MDYFIADTHFGHQNIIRFCDRPFPDAETMDRALIANWNERVNDDDRVYILGDLLYRCVDPIGILSQLKGRKHLLVGNHDHSWLNAPGARDFFVSIADYAQVNDGAHVLIMSHYPMLSYYHEHRSNVFNIDNSTSLEGGFKKRSRAVANTSNFCIRDGLNSLMSQRCFRIDFIDSRAFSVFPSAIACLHFTSAERLCFHAFFSSLPISSAGTSGATESCALVNPFTGRPPAFPSFIK